MVACAGSRGDPSLRALSATAQYVLNLSWTAAYFVSHREGGVAPPRHAAKQKGLAVMRCVV